MSISSAMKLKKWFLQNKRDFPWRKEPSPYAVWVSEVMLQQTRASVVIPYFNRWMKKFPDVVSLAKASLEDVFKVWEGLGYYSRARNLQKGAIQILERGGSIPSSYKELRAIHGIGPYTAGAILSFAFQQKAAAVDGNVARVISRYRGIEGELQTAAKKKLLEEETLGFLPEKQSWVLMEGLIELGATICLPKPSCERCPLKETCTASRLDKTEEIPFKKKRKKSIFLEKQVVIILSGSDVLLEKKEDQKVLGGLIEFPSFPVLVSQSIEEEISRLWGLQVEIQEDLPSERQSYTKYQVELYPSILTSKEKKTISGFFWYPMSQVAKDLTLSSGHRRVLKSVLKQFNT